MTPSGKVILVKALQFSKAEEPIEATLSGIVTLVKALQLRKAYMYKAVTGLLLYIDGITIFSTVSQYSLFKLTEYPVILVKKLK